MSETVYGVYSDPITTRELDSSPHPGGSFGPVFVVLGVIVVVSGVACVVGRLCSKQRRRVKTASDAEVGKQSNPLGPKEWQKPNLIMRDGDIELGFQKKTPSLKNGGNAKPKHKANQPHIHNNGGRKPQVRFAENVL